MFNQLVESISNVEQNAKQGLFFGITAVINASVFTGILVWSIFSFDLSVLGHEDLTLETLVAPAAMPENEPPPVPEIQPVQKTAATNDAPTTHDVLKDPVREISNSTAPPDKISGEKSNATPVRENVPFTIGDRTQRASGDGEEILNRARNGNADVPAITAKQPKIKDDNEKDEAPTIPPKPAPITPKVTTVSKGVINGIAKSLPKPAYPPAAKAIGASGAVNVQVLIDEQGNVISATAVSGHPLLRGAAQSAAKQAKFTPTKLSDQPVRVNGVIVYNFVRQ